MRHVLFHLAIFSFCLTVIVQAQPKGSPDGKRELHNYAAAHQLEVSPHVLPDTTSKDVVQLKNGTVLRGRLFFPLTDSTNKIEVSENYIIVFKMADVLKITKETEAPTDKESQLEVPESDTRNKIEHWYLYFALGYGHGFYPDAIQNSLDQIPSSASHISTSVEIPGVYWSLSDRKTIIGGSVNGIGDSYSLNGSSLQVNQYLLSFSAMHFLNGEIGDGFFVRGDVGLAWLNLQTSTNISATSDRGFGFLLGGGYALPVSNETRLFFNVNYALRFVEGDRYGALSINLGVML